jgi:hypothetical protein
LSTSKGAAILREAISYAAVGAINLLLTIAALGLVLSGCCCLICFGIDSDGERMRRWLRLALIFLSVALLDMAVIIVATVIYRAWFEI